MIVMASQQQEQEAGDGTNFVIAFGGALVEHAEELLRLVSSSVLMLLLYITFRYMPNSLCYILCVLDCKIISVFVFTNSGVVSV